MSRSRAATPSEIQAAAEPLSYTAVLTDGTVQDAALRAETGNLAVPTGFAGQRITAVKPAAVPASPEAISAPTTTQSRRGDFLRMRILLWSSDVTIAAIGAAVAFALDRSHVVVVAVLWVAMMVIRTSRDGRIADLSDLRPYAKLNANFVLLMTLTAIIFNDLYGTRAVLGISAGIAFGGYCVRWLLGKAAVRHRLHLDVGEAVVVVGSLESVSRTITEWETIDLVNIVGVCLSESDFGPEEVKGIPVLGSVADVAALARRMKVDVVAVHDVDKLGGLQLAKLQWALEDEGTQMSIITPMTNTVVDRARVRTAGRRLIVDIAYSRPQGIVAHIKGALDRVMALVALLIAMPVLIVAATLIKITSKGPIIFKQTRVREHGRTFTMYKLRTMSEDAEDRLEELLELNEVGGGLFKMKSDPRITPVGAWLRRLSIDELPQLWNVVIGDMSLIGPRPALPSEVASYDQVARRRLAVKPGLTGLWQVSGRSNLSWDETVRIDSDYVDNWRPGRDISIALRTVKAVLSKDGAH
jgi:exopolysaccharide biosynthesis polyprenyl glycosylphosphotransferase